VLERRGIPYRVNEIQPKEREYQVLFFSNANIWPEEWDKELFKLKSPSNSKI
jgi:hypothetical protein